MSSTTVGRATLTDSTGPGTGDIWNAALVGTAIYDKIDALFTASQSIEGGTGGALLEARVAHTSNTAGSDCRSNIRVAGASGGDPYTFYAIEGVLGWSVGVDNSDSDFFKVALGALGSTQDYLVVATTGWTRLANASANPAAANMAASKQSIAVYTKSNKLVLAYSNGGTMTYISIPLDGSTTTWTHNTTAP